MGSSGGVDQFADFPTTNDDRDGRGFLIRKVF